MTFSDIEDMSNEMDRLRALNAVLVSALEWADVAINPQDHQGISMATWNERLKATTSIIRAALAKAKG